MQNRVLAVVCVAGAMLVAPPDLVAQGETVVPCVGDPMDVAYGSLVSCEISPLGELDLFRFAGVAGEAVLVQTSALGSGVPCFQVRDPGGLYVGGQCGAGGTGGAVLKLTKTGVHSIQVSSTASPVPYALFLDRVLPPSPSASTICNGCALTNLSIDPAFDTDFYVFEGQDGDSVTVTGAKAGGTGNLCLVVVPPSAGGTAWSCGNPARVDHPVRENGPHVILAWADRAGGTLTHSLNFQCFGSCPAPPGLLSCDIALDKASYSDGETVMTSLHLANRRAGSVKTEIKLWLGIPLYGPYSVANIGADGSFALPAGFDQTFGPAPFFQVLPSLPRGLYEYSCRMLDPATGELLRVDLNQFRLE